MFIRYGCTDFMKLKNQQMIGQCLDVLNIEIEIALRDLNFFVII
jgi:hypothetical protein